MNIVFYLCVCPCKHVYVMCACVCFIKEYIISVLEDKLMYLRNCTSRQAYKGPASRKRSSFVFTPRPPELRPPADYNDSLATYEMNLRMLQVEERKPNPNRETVMSLMEKTFFIRRQNILKAPTSVSSLLETFPSLRNYIQVSTLYIVCMLMHCWETTVSIYYVLLNVIGII